MKSIGKYLAAVAAGLVCSTGVVYAAPGLNVPEPGSIALVAIAVAGLVVVARAGKK